ncbi:hypothetical protein [Glutamicibacter sp. Je.9.36]|uniref:hypothetical protein n=1 Tax=Glutamicibacter sp. Je.9.36 TaxID=3142837 RepID=UPI003DA9B4F5
MKIGRLKALGTVLLVLAVVGTVSSWSVTGDDRLAYTLINVLLFVMGTAALFLENLRSRVRGICVAHKRID